MKEPNGVKKRRYKPKVDIGNESKQKKKETQPPPKHIKKYRKQNPTEASELEDMEDLKNPYSSELENMVEEIDSESPSESANDMATSELDSMHNILSARKYSSRRTLEFELENPLPQETNKQSSFSILTTDLGSDNEEFNILLEKEWQTITCLVDFPKLCKKPRTKKLRIHFSSNFPELWKKPRKKRARNLMKALALYKGEKDAKRLRSMEKGPLANQKRMNKLIFGNNQVHHDNDIGLLVRELESLCIEEEDTPLDTVQPLDLVCYPVKSLDLDTIKPESKKNKYRPKVVLGHTPLDTVQPLDLACYPVKPLDLDTVKPESKKNKYRPKVVLDKETLERWRLLKANDFREGKKLLKNIVDTREDEKEEWNDKTKELLDHFETFVTRLTIVQGNRKPSRWHGSVLDSVVGVYLTQNVSDALSSSTYMEVASRHPVPAQNNSQQCLSLGPINKDVLIIQSPNVEESFGLSQDENGTKEINGEDSADYVKRDILTDEEKEEKADLKGNKNAEENKTFDWDKERLKYSSTGLRHIDTMDSVDWNSVKNAPLDQIKDAIKRRGMYNTLAKKIQKFLKETELNDNGDLEWLRNAPIDVVQGYLLRKDGLGLKSVECIRLLALNQHAFPVDVNVARITTRLGWVPLQELPDGIKFHQLEEYPNADAIQKYLWPRLCTLSTEALYELHYHLITFGKVFCTKRNPNCNACPLKDECKHFALANSRSNLNLPPPEQNKPHHVRDLIVDEYEEPQTNIGPDNISNRESMLKVCDSTVELPPSPEPYRNLEDVREQEDEDVLDTDIEDIHEIHMPKTKEEEYITSIASALEIYVRHQPDLMKALVSIPTQKSKNKITNRLKSIHNVYILEDGHRLLESFDKRVTGDQCHYLLAIWDSPDIITDENEQVRGTILIPSRTALGGRFPLNGTYFQTNEVFADGESSRSHSHVHISKKELSHLQTQPLYCGTSIFSICRGMSLLEIMYCFIRGSICVRGFNRKTRGPLPLRHELFGGSTSKKQREEEQYEYKDSDMNQLQHHFYLS